MIPSVSETNPSLNVADQDKQPGPSPRPNPTPQATPAIAAPLATSTPKKSLKEFGQMIKEKYPTAYDDLSDEDLGTKAIKKYPQYQDMVDLQPMAQGISTQVSPTKVPTSTFERQLTESLQPTSGQVQVGVPATQRIMGKIPMPITPELEYQATSGTDQDLVDAANQHHFEELGIPREDYRKLRDLGVSQETPADVAQYAHSLRGAIRGQIAQGGNQLQLAFPQSDQQIAEAYKQGGLAAAHLQAKMLGAESAKTRESIHDITPDEVAKVETARRAVSFKLGLANATLGQNEFWTNILSLPAKLATGYSPEGTNLIPGSEAARTQLGNAKPFLPEFYKNQSLGQAMIEVAPGVALSTTRMVAAAAAGTASMATSVGPTIGSILGIQADTAIQNLDKPLTEQATHQLITLAMTGGGAAAGVARNVLAARGIFVPTMIYTPAEGLAMALATYGSMELLTPEANFNQKLANSIAGGLVPLGFAAARGLTPSARVKPQQPIPEPQKLLGPGFGQHELPETFPIYSDQFKSTGYKVGLSRPGEQPLDIPYDANGQIPLFDAVIGGQKIRGAMAKGLATLPDDQLQQAYKDAGGMYTHMPEDRQELLSTTLDLLHSRLPLMEATTQNQMPIIEKWLGITREDTLMETPFQYGKTYRVVDEGPGYWRVEDLSNPNHIFRIGKGELAGLAATLENVTSETHRVLERTLVVPDFTGHLLETQPMLFPEPQAGSALKAEPGPATGETSREGAISRLGVLRDFAATKEFSKLPASEQAKLKSEAAQLHQDIATPSGNRQQQFVQRPEAEQHLQNLKAYSQRPEFKEMVPDYQELVGKEIRDLDFLLNKNKGSEEDVRQQQLIYSPDQPEGSQPSNLRDRAVNQAEAPSQKLLPPGQYDLGPSFGGGSEKFPISTPLNFIEKSIVETMAEGILPQGAKEASEVVPVDLSTPAPASSPLWRAVSKSPTETLVEVAKRAGQYHDLMSRTELEHLAYDTLGGKREAPAEGSDPSFITNARVRLADYSSGRQLGGGQQLFDQALVYTYDYLYKPGMRFLDFAEKIVEKFGDEINPYIHDLWDRARDNVKPQDITAIAEGADTKYGSVLAQVPEETLPKPVGAPEQIALAMDTSVHLSSPVENPKISYEKALYPEDWTNGVDTTPEEVASHVQQITQQNRLVSKETYDQARAEIKSSLSQLNAGISPRQLRAMSTVMAYHVKSGFQKFGSFARKAVDLYGDVAKANMYDLWEDTHRYIDTYANSPVLNKLTQLPGGKQLGAVIAKASTVTFSGVDAFRRVFALASRSPEAREIGDLISRQESVTARNMDILKAQLGPVHSWAERQTKVNRLELNFALDEGKEQALLKNLNAPNDVKVLINEMRTALGNMRTNIQSVSPNALQTVVENYFPRLYKYGSSYASAQLANVKMGKPFETAKTFLKARTVDSMRSAVEEMGFQLHSENFVDNFIYKYTEMEKFVQMRRVTQYMQKNGYEKIVNEAKIPEGYKVLNDPISKILKQVTNRQGETEYQSQGTVRVYPNTIADLINAHLAPSLHTEPAFRAWNSFANFANNFQLVGLFHLALVGMDSAFRPLGTGIKGFHDAAQHLAHGEGAAALGALREGSKNLAQGAIAPLAFANTLVRGHQMLSEWDSPGTYPNMAGKVKFLQEGGVQARMEGHLQGKAIDGIIRNARNVAEIWNDTNLETGEKLWGTTKEVAAMTARMPLGAIDSIMGPIMEEFVPRAKLGVQYYLAGYEMSRMGPQAKTKDVRRVMAKVRDVTDDTLGQLNYGNLHMNKATKEIMMSLVRASGFQIGSERTAYMPIVEGAKYAKAALTPGERADFTHRMAYLIAMPLGASMMNVLAQSLLSYYNTGKVLDFQPKDAVAFRSGKKDQNGDDERMYLPNYFTKEIYPVFSRVAEGRFSDAAHVKAEMFSHKINPGLNMIKELWGNQDFYGRYIVDPNSPESKVSQLGDYALDQLKPFFLKNKEMLEQRGNNDWMAKYGSFFGVTPAPQYINASTAEDVMMGITKEHYPKAGKSSAEYEHGVLKRKYLNQYRQATLLGDEKILDQVEEAMDKDIEAGKLLAKDRGVIRKGVDKTRTQELFSKLSVPDSIRIYESWMSPQEKALVVQQLRKNRGKIKNLPISPEDKELLTQRLDAILDRDQNLEQILQELRDNPNTTPNQPPEEPPQ